VLRKELKTGDIFRFAGEREDEWRMVVSGVGPHTKPPAVSWLSNTGVSARLDEEVILKTIPNPATATAASVVSPQHYADIKPEPIEVIEAWGFDRNHNIASALAYIARHGKKPGCDAKDDLLKARRFLSREIARLEGRRAWE